MASVLKRPPEHKSQRQGLSQSDKILSEICKKPVDICMNITEYLALRGELDMASADSESWFALEAAIAQRQPIEASYGQALFGGCVEPGHQEECLVDMRECPECGRWRLRRCDFERAEGGSLNFYYSESCDACGHYETDADEDLP